MTEKLMERKALERIVDFAIDRQCGDKPHVGSGAEVLAQLYTARAVLHLADVVAEQTEKVDSITAYLFTPVSSLVAVIPGPSPEGGDGAG
jgi:hypothetical protein